MKFPLLLSAATAALAVVLGAPAPAPAQDAAATLVTPGVVGSVVLDFPATADKPLTVVVSAPLLADRLDAATADAVGPRELRVAAPLWRPGQFTDPAAPSWVFIVTGAQAGRVLPVTDNTETALTLDVDDGGTETVALDTPGFALAPGDRFEILPARTLGTLFGRTAEALAAGGVLTPGGSPDDADTVGLWNDATGDYSLHYFDTGVGHWTRAGAPSSEDYTDLVVPPGAALAVRRQPGRAAGSLALTGSIPTAAPLFKLPGGPRHLGTLLPVDVTLGQLNFGRKWKRGEVLEKVDLLSIYKPTSAKAKAYYLGAGKVWRKLASPEADRAATVIPAGRAVLFDKRKAVAGPLSFFSVPLPYQP